MVASFSFLSPLFWSIALSAILLLAVFRGSARQVAFMCVNLSFLWVLLGPKSSLAILANCLLGFGLVQLILRWPRWAFRIGLPTYIVLFIYLRNYGVWGFVLPESLLATMLSTIGLSFLTFKVIHVMIEARSGTLRDFEFWTFLNFCLNFTTFMMGPIQRYEDYRQQWYGERLAIPLEFESHLNAVLRILLGLIKAYVLADFIQNDFLSGFRFEDATLGSLLVNAYAFYFFIYLNFSGYCDVAIGTGCLMGIRPPENFNLPFLSRNISDFWLRQHRSLTLWLTDYVFSPLFKRLLTSGPFVGRPLAAMNVSMMVTMIICGIWHGTTIGFLLFGIVHGLYLVIYRTWDAFATWYFGKRRLKQLRKTWFWQLCGIFLTFNATALAFIFFRIDSQQLFDIIEIWTVK